MNSDSDSEPMFQRDDSEKMVSASGLGNYQLGENIHLFQSKSDKQLGDQTCDPLQEGGKGVEKEKCASREGDETSAQRRHQGQAQDLLAYFCRGEPDHDDASDQSYVTISFGPGQQALTLMDSGNMVGSAMSGELVKKLNLPLQPCSGTNRHAAVAPDGRKLDILGQTPPLQFTLEGAPNTIFTESFVVINNLSHQVNLGKAWMSQHRAIHDHGQETMKLKRPQQQGWCKIRLRGPHMSTEDDQCNYVYAAMRTRVPARSARFLHVTVPGMKEEKEIVISPVEGTKNPTLLANSVSRVKDQTALTSVFNPLDKAVYIEKWCKLGTVDHLEQQEVLGAMSTERKCMTPSVGDTSPSSKNKEELREWMRKEFRLQDSDVLRDKPREMEELEELLLEFEDVISKCNTDYGRTDLMEMTIDLVPGAVPYKGRCLPTNPKQEEDLLKTLETWNREGVTEPANSPWGAPLIPVPKKDGRIRWCVDFRKLNAVTVKDSFPLPLITTNLHKLGNSSIYSTIDGTGAYHNVQIQERDRPLTAFVSPFGQFQFKRMPFGLTNAPQVYSRLIQMVIQGCDVRHVLAYIDDILAHTNTIKEHMKVLRQVFEAHRRAGLKIAPAKTFLFRSKVDYLGHQVSSKGIEMVDKYVDLLLKWPKPTTSRELATFLGKTGYYRTFIKDYGKIAACLEAEKKKPALVWTPQMDQAFETLKQAFSHKPILAYPDYPGVEQGRPFIYDTDWSQEGMAQQLSQLQPGPDGMRERVIANRGRKCTQAERNYSSNKGETASFVDGLEGFEHMLRYAPFKARVDNRCLSYIRNLKKPTGIWWRWLDLIDSFQFDIEHRAGKKHGNVDALSRAPHLPEPTQAQEELSAAYLCALTSDRLEQVDELNRATLEELTNDEQAERDVTLPLSAKQIRQAQRDDPDVRKMINWIGRGVKPEKDERRLESLGVQQMLQDFELFSIQNGQLFRKTMEHEPKAESSDRLVLPRGLRDTAFYWAHAHPTAGHMGMKVTQQRMRARFYFPGLYDWVEKQILGCHSCIRKRKPTRVEAKPRNIQKGFPGARWSLDLVGPLPESNNGNLYILTAEENFTRWPCAVGIPDRTAETVAKAFEKMVLAEHGSCQELLTDNAAELTGHIMADVAKILGITKVTTTPYNPNGNKIERWHRTLSQMLRTVVAEDQRDWDECLGACLLAYRTSVHATTKLTPFFLQHGREAILPVDIIFDRPPQDYEVATEFGKEMTERLDAAFSYVREQQKKVIRRQVALSGEMANDKKLKEGDLVWYYSPRQQVGTAKKLHVGWKGPFKITRVISEVSYIITPHGDWTLNRPLIPTVIHRLQRYYPDTAKGSPKTLATEQELLAELVDRVDDNLVATDEVEVEVCPQQHSGTKVKVQIPETAETDEIEDIVTRRNKEGGGRTAIAMEKIQFLDKVEEADVEMKEGRLEEKEQSRTRGLSKDETGHELLETENNVTAVAQESIEDEVTRQTISQQRDKDCSAKVSRQPKEQVVEQRAVTRRSTRIQERGGGPFAQPMQLRNQGSATSVRTHDSPHRPAPPPVPAYMAAAAQATSVSPEVGTKRPREEDTESLNSQKSFKGLNSLTRMSSIQEGLAHMHVSLTSRRRPYPWEVHDDQDERHSVASTSHPRQTPVRHSRGLIELPYHRVVLEDGAKMPVRGSINAAGYDCFAARETRIARGTTVAVPLGFRISPSAGVYMQLVETSSWPMQKPMFILRAGAVDPDYRGSVVALMTYLGPEEFGYIDKHERVCQMIPTCFRGDPFHVCNSLPSSGRGENAGFARLQKNTDGGCNQKNPDGGCNGCRRMSRDQMATRPRGQPDGTRARAVPDEDEWAEGFAPPSSPSAYTLRGEYDPAAERKEILELDKPREAVWRPKQDDQGGEAGGETGEPVDQEQGESSVPDPPVPPHRAPEVLQRFPNGLPSIGEGGSGPPLY